MASKRSTHIFAGTCTFASVFFIISDLSFIALLGEETAQCVRLVICLRRRLMKDGIQEEAAASAAGCSDVQSTCRQALHAHATGVSPPYMNLEEQNCSVIKARKGF